jgi:hypothetical protein
VNDAPATQRRDEVLLMCSDLLAALVPSAALAPLVPRSADAQPTAAGPSAWSDGCTTAVQLLPTLLRAADAIEALVEKLPIPKKLRELNLTEADLMDIATHTEHEYMMANLPRPVSTGEVLALLKSCW